MGRVEGAAVGNRVIRLERGHVNVKGKAAVKNLDFRIHAVDEAGLEVAEALQGAQSADSPYRQGEGD